MVAVLPGLVVGLNEPQLPLGAQLQVTPAFVESLATTAIRVAVALICSDPGGAGVSDTEMPAGAVTVMVVCADLVESVTDVATIVTLPPADGAV